MKHSPSLLGIIFILTLTAVVPAFAQNSAGTLVVMTYNVNEGTDFLQVLSATNALQFLLGVGDIVDQVQGTNPPERMKAVAAQILLAKPTLVSLQEVDQWYQGAFSPLTVNRILELTLEPKKKNSVSHAGGICRARSLERHEAAVG